MSSICEDAIAHHGNTYRLKEFMKRAKNGENLAIGFIGEKEV